MQKLSAILTNLENELPEERVCVRDVMDSLHERGRAMLLFLFALPAALPMPGLGINLIIAAPLLFITVQQMLGTQGIWLPERIKNKCISRETVDKILNKAIPYIALLERFVKPRISLITHGLFKNLIGIAGVIMTLSICIPLPLTNTVPAFAIAVMSVGVIMHDGLAVIAGMVLGLIWVGLLCYAFYFFGVEGLDLVKETIKSYM